jgi:allantoinase
VTAFVLRSTRVLTRDGLAPRALLVRDGKIARIGAHHDAFAGVPDIAAGDDLVMPGLVDTHVHVNEPGRTDWEGFATATRAAAAGGVTTVLDMPLNSIPATTTVESLRAKRDAARGQCSVDVGFLGGVVPGNSGELAALHRAGVAGFKCFLVPSGVPEFAHVTERDLREALPVLRQLGATLMVHAELPGPITAAGPMASPRRYASYLASRPRAAENDAIALMIALAEEFGARVHIVHLSSSDALPMIEAAQLRGVPVSVETCPHYLHFAAEEIADGATEFKCAPPIRERTNGEALWRALGHGTISMVVSDHSPCPISLKHRDSGDFAAAWGGVTSLQLGLPIVWNGMRARGVALEKVADWMCATPARLAHLSHRKGAIAEGLDADLVVWRPESEFTVRALMLRQRHPYTAYLGARLPGVVVATYLRGECCYANESVAEAGVFLNGAAAGPRGTLLGREDFDG